MSEKKNDPRYADPSTGPDLMMAEMEKRKTEKPTTKTYTEDEVKKMQEDAVEAERKRIASIDEGFSDSSRETVISSNDPLYQEKWKAWKNASKRHAARGQDWSEKAFKETLAYGDKARKASPL